MTIFLIVLLTALVFECINGFHDAANAIATVVSTKVLTPRQAIWLAAFFNLVGALWGTAVATTIGKGIVDSNVVTMTTIFAGLMGAGRTEVMRTIFGADRLEAGEIYVHGKRLHVREPYDAVAAGIGYLSEDRKRFGLATGMDVEANITLPSLKRWLSWRFFLNRRASESIAPSWRNPKPALLAGTVPSKPTRS